MSKTYGAIELTPEQEAEATRIEALLRSAVDADLRQMARLLASKEDRHLLGETEFELRDVVQRIGAKAVEVTVNERSKKGVPR